MATPVASDKTPSTPGVAVHRMQVPERVHVRVSGRQPLHYGGQPHAPGSVLTMPVADAAAHDGLVIPEPVAAVPVLP